MVEVLSLTAEQEALLKKVWGRLVEILYKVDPEDLEKPFIQHYPELDAQVVRGLKILKRRGVDDTMAVLIKHARSVHPHHTEKDPANKWPQPLTNFILYLMDTQKCIRVSREGEEALELRIATMQATRLISWYCEQQGVDRERLLEELGLKGALSRAQALAQERKEEENLTQGVGLTLWDYHRGLTTGSEIYAYARQTLTKRQLLST